MDILDFGSFLKYSRVCAQAVRNVMKPELKAQAARRSESTMKFQKWEAGKPSESSTMSSSYECQFLIQ